MNIPRALAQSSWPEWGRARRWVEASLGSCLGREDLGKGLPRCEFMSMMLCVMHVMGPSLLIDIYMRVRVCSSTLS
jgi:hypothetical protein